MAAKYIQLAELIQQRLDHGDYGFCTMPGAQKLAEEVGVSYLTARQAIQKLIGDGVLNRSETGRLAIPDSRRTSRLKVAFVQPAGSFSDFWRGDVLAVAMEFGVQFREIFYCYKDDPLLFDALNGDFDLILLNFNRNDGLFVEKLKRNHHRLVTMFHDLTRWGVRCLDGITPQATRHLIQHFYDRGCRKIDCFNTQPYGIAVRDRVEAWRRGIAEFGCSGEFYNYPVSQFKPALAQARVASEQIFAQGGFEADAVFGISIECATGLIRSAFNCGIRVPDQLLVGSFGGLDWARNMVPSITVVDAPDVKPPIREVFEHFTGIRPQPDKLMFRAPDVNSLWLGESTEKQ